MNSKHRFQKSTIWHTTNCTTIVSSTEYVRLSLGRYQPPHPAQTQYMFHEPTHHCMMDSWRILLFNLIIRNQYCSWIGLNLSEVYPIAI